MRINFGPLAFVMLLVLVMAAGFGFLLTSTEATNPSLQRAQATVTLMNAGMDLSLTATSGARQNNLTDAGFAPQFATATSIALDTRLRAGAATATATALENQQRAAEINLAERKATLDWQRKTNQIWDVVAIVIVLSLVLVVLMAACVIVNDRIANKRTALLHAQAELAQQDRRRSQTAAPTGAKMLTGNGPQATTPPEALKRRETRP